MSGVKELSGPFYGPSFTASDINFFSWAGHIPCLQLFSAGISQLWLLQNLRVATVTQVSFSHFTQGPLTAASPFWAVTQGFRCHVLPGLSGSQKPQNKNPRPLHSSVFHDSKPNTTCEHCQGPSAILGWTLALLDDSSSNFSSQLLSRTESPLSLFPKLEAYLGGALRGASLGSFFQCRAGLPLMALISLTMTASPQHKTSAS